MSLSTEELENIFSKKFTFEKNLDWKLPPLSDWYKDDVWQIKELADLKVDLNKTKSKLNDKKLPEWQEHTTFTHLASGVIPELRKHIKPELLTKAWCKFYEILNVFPICEISKSNTFNSIHLCEAPGAFVASLNHYLKSHHPETQWTWLANTLNPYYEGNTFRQTITDDRFMIHTLEKWHFGRSNSGNIMEETYLEDLLCYVSGAEIQLVTADGSIDCTDIPEEQEGEVSQLTFTEVVVALHVLSVGGNLVMKMFTMFEEPSVSLMYLLNCVFQQVNVFKPSTSKPGNSEVYVVCLKYLGWIGIQPHLEILSFQIAAKQESKKALFMMNQIPSTFLEQLILCCKNFKIYQEEEINRNLTLYKTSYTKKFEVQLNQSKDLCAKYYIEKYSVIPIADSARVVRMIVGSDYLSLFQYGNISLRKYTSLDQRRQEHPSSLMKQLRTLERSLEPFAPMSNVWKPEFEHNSVFKSNLDAECLILTTGKSFEVIYNSVFCHPVLIKSWDECFNSLIGKRSFLSRTKNWTKETTDVLEKHGIHVVNESRQDILKNVLVSYHFTKETPNNQNLNVYSTSSPDFLPGNSASTVEKYKQEKYKSLILKGCIQILDSVGEGDMVVLRINAALSRFVVGLLYLMASTFQSCEVMPPKGYRINEPSLWCFKCFEKNLWSNQVLEHLRSAKAYIDSMGTGTTILELVSLLTLSRSGFAEFVQNQNIDIVARTLLRIIKEEMSNLRMQKRNSISDQS